MLAEHSLSRQIVRHEELAGYFVHKSRHTPTSRKMGNRGKLEGEYRWLAWAEDKSGASCGFDFKGVGWDNVG